MRTSMITPNLWFLRTFYWQQKFIPAWPALQTHRHLPFRLLSEDSGLVAAQIVNIIAVEELGPSLKLRLHLQTLMKVYVRTRAYTRYVRTKCVFRVCISTYILTSLRTARICPWEADYRGFAWRSNTYAFPTLPRKISRRSNQSEIYDLERVCTRTRTRVCSK